jgi:hypothetical protein
MEQLLARPALNYRYPVVSPSARLRMESAAPYGSRYGRESAAPSRLQRLALAGLATSTQQYVAAGAGAASGGAQIAVSPTVGGKVIGAGGIIASAAPLAGPAAPVVAIAGAVVAAVGTIMQFLHLGDGCGQSCILTSNWANDAETNIRALVNAYFSQPAPRLTTSRDAALRAFDAIWNQLAQACAQVKGPAGTNCTGDRQSGSCHFHQTGDSPWPGGPKVGECWNWFSAYRDPIAHDPDVVTPDPLDPSGGSLFPSGSGGGLTLGNLDSKTVLLIGGALLLIGAMGN